MIESPTTARSLAHVAWMRRIDMPTVLRIERDSFDHPWDAEEFMDCLRQRTCIGMVAGTKATTLGFMIYELHEERLNVLNFAVAPEHRRHRVGSLMLAKLVRKLSSHRRTSLTVVVRESNLGAQLFFRQREFRAVRVLRGYYEDTGEDGYLMEYKVDLSEVPF